MSDSISIMDLGLNEFRLDLLEYVKNHSDITKKPRGLHAVAPAQKGLPEGIIFVLKNINDTINVITETTFTRFIWCISAQTAKWYAIILILR